MHRWLRGWTLLHRSCKLLERSLIYTGRRSLIYTDIRSLIYTGIRLLIYASTRSLIYIGIPVAFRGSLMPGVKSLFSPKVYLTCKNF